MKTEFRIERNGPVLDAHGRYGVGEAHGPRRANTTLRHSAHVFACLGVVHTGRVEFRTPQGAAVAGAGSILFGNRNEEFSYRYFDMNGARRSVIAFSEELLDQAAAELGARPRFTLACLPLSRVSVALYGRARQIVASQRAQEEDVLALLSEVLALGTQRWPTSINQTVRRRLREVAQYIDDEHSNELSLATLAAMSHMSKFHFLRSFTAEIGESPGRYLVAARLRAAANRLIETNESIASIAMAVGFNDLSHFNATFRQTFGASPRAWRRC